MELLMAENLPERSEDEGSLEEDEAPKASINTTALSRSLFGDPLVQRSTMIDWVCDWVERGMPDHGIPTGYQRRDGRF